MSFNNTLNLSKDGGGCVLLVKKHIGLAEDIVNNQSFSATENMDLVMNCSFPNKGLILDPDEDFNKEEV